jgi:hypothetical protein
MATNRNWNCDGDRAAIDNQQGVHQHQHCAADYQGL